MKQIVIQSYLIMYTIAAIVLFFLLITKPTKTNVDLKQTVYNDSVLLREYQQTLEILMDKHPACADTFMQVIEKINTTDGE